MRYFLRLEYNGSNFFGWQIQPNHISVQESIETGLKLILKEEIEVVGCGRTDTGVHAKDYFAHFDYKELSDEKINQLKFRLNRYFSFDINIKSILRVRDNAHSRFDAIDRTYKYYIAKDKQPFNNDFLYYFPRELDMEEMNLAASKLFNYEDFTSFSKLHTQVNNNNCKILYAKWEIENGLLVFTISANRFLRNMVRAITGTLLEVGLGKISVEDFERIIEAKDRNKAGRSVSAKGLFLYSISYPNEIFL